ncbi:hypothetical protein G6F46_007576 [Rhizopus delemar]|uniref:Tethering factor for nuclear proteasome STS1 n=2 Tax=Rhizopus TaxID=4842 RepID=A0A9P6YQ03_9FUNG|nr:hypothetical protein G6F43_006897 [Rhizopus delemar]KAG1532511.1 hypothetical protein G6F51_013071 [Rhizopus arrhizus]KAG1442991.1 hypothetical protein G6F55_012802 [Rhizopus delemar]KAG1544043.1 hypothetical protein G6F49_011179 [Rhizopus delemar]KAG1553508.1 hypothetical protein G6F50_013046 [Rhizopus delemar]
MSSSSQSQNSLFRQQQRLYRSSIYLTKTKVPTLYTQPISNEHNSNKGRKRRASYEDEEMMNSEPLIEDNVLHITKRNRITSKKDLPIGKLLATLDKEKLIELINDLVDSNPHLKAEFEAQIKQQ